MQTIGLSVDVLRRDMPQTNNVCELPHIVQRNGFWCCAGCGASRPSYKSTSFGDPQWMVELNEFTGQHTECGKLIPSV